MSSCSTISPTQITDQQKERFLKLFRQGIGVIVLHRAYLSYPMWGEYERIAGGKYVCQRKEEMINGITSSTYKGDVDITSPSSLSIHHAGLPGVLPSCTTNSIPTCTC